MRINQFSAKQELLNGISPQYVNKIRNWLGKQKRQFDDNEEEESFEGFCV